MPETRINDIIDVYQVIEIAARGERSLFLTIRNAIEGFYWLLESATPFDDLETGNGVTLEAGGRHYFAFEIGSPSVADLLEVVPHLDASFAGWRWVRLLESFGPMHQSGQTLPPDRRISLNSLKFTKASHLTISMDAASGERAEPFVAPEARNNRPTPTSDVYTLAALLWAAVGDTGTNPALSAVLAQATAADPSTRPADGHALAEALKHALPKREVGSLEEVSGQKPSGRTAFGTIDGIMMALGPIAAFGILIAGLMLFRSNLPGLDLLNLPFLSSGPTLSPLEAARAARARGTVVPLPAGPLAFASYTSQLDAPCSLRIDMTLSKGGAPIPNGANVEFDVWLNGKAMSGVVVSPSTDVNSSRWSIAFSAPGFCPGGGAIRVRARAGDSDADLTICEFGQPSDAVAAASLQDLSIIGAQVDVTSFPALSAYFTAINAQSTGTRLRGSFRCSLSIDGAPVNDFKLSAVDSLASPVTVALALDVSGSMRGAALANAKTAASEFVRQIGAGSAVCLYSFSTTVKQLTNCTTDRAAVLAAIDGLTADGNTALRDVVASIAANQRQLGGRQAVIVLTDGADTASRTSLEEMLAKVQQLNVPIYMIGLSNPDLTPDVLRQIAARSGGHYTETPDSAALKDLYEQIRGQLATQYQLRFDSPAPDRKSGAFTLRITERERAVDLSRTYAAP